MDYLLSFAHLAALNEDLVVRDELYGWHHGQSDNKISLVDGDKVLGYLNYSSYDGKAHINMVKSFYPRMGYGELMIDHLANSYGYPNIVWGMLVDAGAVRFKEQMDKKYKYNRKEYEAKNHVHIKQADIKRVKDPDARNFLEDLVKFGDEAWEKLTSKIKKGTITWSKLDAYDLTWNDLSDIAEWIYGSVTNDNDPLDDEVPHVIMGDFKKLIR